MAGPDSSRGGLAVEAVGRGRRLITGTVTRDVGGWEQMKDRAGQGCRLQAGSR